MGCATELADEAECTWWVHEDSEVTSNKAARPSGQLNKVEIIRKVYLFTNCQLHDYDDTQVMTRPVLVLFDLGKVLVDFDWHIAARQISARANATPAEIFELLTGTDWLMRFECGHISGEQLFEELQQVIGYRAGVSDFRQAFSNKFSAIPGMIELHARIREAGIATWILSNTNEWAISQIRNQFPFFAEFDGYILSYQLGIMKPNDGIYAAAEDLTACLGRQILYIDDSKENITAGAARGWQTIHHVSPNQTVLDVQRVLFP